MAENELSKSSDRQQLRNFTRAVLEDVQALERMLREGRIESDIRRIGAEQEMFLIDRDVRPAPIALEVLEHLDHPQFTTELALFNLEANLSPYAFGGDCLSRMERELHGLLALAHRAADANRARILLTGILPTIRQNDLGLESMTPNPRYMALNHTMVEHRGGQFRMRIQGIDELMVTHDNVMFEACNASFQIHFQVAPEEFARLYNLAQLVTGPVLAAAVNSPIFLQHRLWSETRVALLQQSIDVRSDHHQSRQARPRVVFGDRWVEESILEIFREDIARFRMLISTDLGESPLTILDRGEIPPLKALCLHNGTIYRWNRPCYGIHEGKAHLRIEHRLLPAGPTVVDEIANAAFFFGLMAALSQEYGDVSLLLPFEDAKRNMLAAARSGLAASFHWVGGTLYQANELILEHLLPMAQEGLKSHDIRSADIDRYLGVIEGRVRSRQTGARWTLRSLDNLRTSGKREERFQALTACMYRRHLDGHPVHEWPVQEDWPAEEPERGTDWRASWRTVDQVMTTDLFTVNPEDLIDLAASLMDWEHIRHVPVEDHEGRLVGLVTHRHLLRLIARGLDLNRKAVAVREIMLRDPITIGPGASTMEVIEMMKRNQVSCLPVVDEDNRLVGIISERDFITVASKLLEVRLREEQEDD
jgi:CBS domain-containing protein